MKEIDLKINGQIKRLTNKTFKFDERIGEGWFSAVYFLKTQQIVEKFQSENTVTMQFFQRRNAILCGIDEAIALLHTFAKNPEQLEIHALHDGDSITPFETVLTITGPYQAFGYLEGLIDGILARRTSVATHAMNEWWGKQGMGTMPHALIQIFNGDIVAAARAYHATFPDDNLVALVDYNNDVIADTLKVANEFGEKLYGVRIDTSATMIDQYFMRHPEVLGTFDPRGVNPELIFALRKALDDAGHKHVKIIASGGLTAAKIRRFEEIGTPVDTYGVGSSLLKVNIGFTGDNVKLNGEDQAKAGRLYRPNPRLEKVDYIKEH